MTHITPQGFTYVEASQATSLLPGAKVTIKACKGSVLDWPLDGLTGELLGFSKPHGFAIVKLDHSNQETLIHPENIVCEV